MGLFSLKKKTPKRDSSPASFMSASTVIPSPALTETASLPPPPSLRLRVAIDPVPELESDNEMFYIELDLEDDVESIRRNIAAKTGITSMALFKAQFQARSYMNRYANPVHLLNHFPTWNLDDPAQLIPSLGQLGEATASPPRNHLKAKDWFPANSNDSDMVQILACPCPEVSSSEKPITLIAHFAPNDPSRSARPTSSSPPVARRHREPAVVHISPRATIDQLKEEVLKADGRTPGMLDKVVMWRVEMSEQELIVIEERGGLKGGRMPWPYPPTAPVPTALENGSAPLSEYYGDYQFDGRMVHLTVWIHPSAANSLAPLLAPQAEDAPQFKYPMTFSPIEESVRRVSACHSLPPHSPTCSPPPVNETVAKVKCRRSRPSTAPAVVVSPSGSPAEAPAFGSGSVFGREKAGSKNGSARGRLTRLGPSPLGAKGLGLGVGEDNGDLTPELDFSNLRLSVEFIDTAPVTPPVAVGPEWNPAEYGLGVGGITSKSKSLGLGAAKRTTRVPEYA